MENKKQANTDTTYCTSKTCKERCWRHTDNYEFDENREYWFTSGCE